MGICSSKPNVYSPRHHNASDVESDSDSGSVSRGSTSPSSTRGRDYHMETLSNISSARAGSITAGCSRNTPGRSSPPGSLQRQKDELLRRIGSEGSHFRTTPRERAEFKAAYIAHHASDYDGGESAWENVVWHMESLQQRHPDLQRMTIEDMAALHAWTITLDYKTVQDILEPDQAPTAHGLAYAKSIISGFHSLPKSCIHRGPVHSIGNQPPQWVNERFQAGQVNRSQRFFSAAETREGAQQSKEASGHNARVEWVTHSVTGKSISLLSLHPKEKEVLFLPGTRFRVDDVSYDPYSGKTHIQQQEI